MATTLWLDDDTKDRFDAAKPYDSMSAGEFLNELLDDHEES